MEHKTQNNMDNDGSQEIVRKRANQLSGTSSSKEIARKVVEEEFRRKKKRNRGGGGGHNNYASSSDEDDNDNHNKVDRRARKSMKMDKDEEKKESAKSIEEDHATRYRDRAKERREGRFAIDEREKESTSSPQPDLLIIPHNKKGLDINLIRKEQQRIKAQSIPLKASPTAKFTRDVFNVGKEMPSMEEAMQILREFVQDSFLPSTTMSFSQGITEYIREYVKWTNEHFVGKYDSVSCGTVGRTLQNTGFAFAIDGNPCDPARAWQRPRQYTTSSISTSFSTTPMLTSGILDQIVSVFHKRKLLLSEMKQQPMTTLSSPKKMESEKEVDYCDKDDNIFDDLDEYVPPGSKRKD
jgi:hypothetical protein